MEHIAHHGIKGMRWGVRRYQNPDGSLTPAGKKRVSKQYRRSAEIANKHFKMQKDGGISETAYNKSADYMNKGGIDKFNTEQRKKYGEDYTKRDGYVEDYYKEFDKLFSKNFNKQVNEFYDNNPEYKKAKALVDKYNMTEWDKFAKKNEAAVKEARKMTYTVEEAFYQ